MVEPSLVSSTLGFQCTRPRWPLWGFCGSRNHFLKDKRKYKGFSFVLSASLLGSESPESVDPSNRQTLEKQKYVPGQVGAQDPTSQPTVPSVLKGARVPLRLAECCAPALGRSRRV